MEGLLPWYDAHRRDLPWRHGADPYRVLVSEVMLQQTRVETVLSRFTAWFERFPTVEALAAASEEAVMAAWSGLGYYRRSRNLHAAARRIARDGWPNTVAGLRALPGIGEYTAAAVASICFDAPEPAIDGNLARVLSRVHDIPHDVTRGVGKRVLRAAADAAIDPERPGDWNQALMDLGATVCMPKPRCGSCPLACLARERGTAADRPVRPTRAPARREKVHFAYVEHGGAVLLAQRQEGLLAGTWGLPGGPADEGLASLVRDQTGVAVTTRPAARLDHAFTHVIWDMDIHIGKATAADHGTWQPLDRLDALGLSTAARKAIAAARAANR